MYQKQSQTQNEFEKNLIAKFDDSTKKNTAPPKNTGSRPGVSIVYPNSEGDDDYEVPVPTKKQQPKTVS